MNLIQSSGPMLGHSDSNSKLKSFNMNQYGNILGLDNGGVHLNLPSKNIVSTRQRLREDQMSSRNIQKHINTDMHMPPF